MNNSVLTSLTMQEIYSLVDDYIRVLPRKFPTDVVKDGSLGDFTRESFQEFYRDYCNLDINLDDYEGETIRDIFLHILTYSNPVDQIKIIQGIFKKYPVECFPMEERPRKESLKKKFDRIINRLNPIDSNNEGVDGEIKNLIFASNGLKPEIILEDSISNKIKIVKNEEHCLVYDLPITNDGLKWTTLLKWWIKKYAFSTSNQEADKHLIQRLRDSLQSPPEILLFDTYYEFIGDDLIADIPALIPQIYLHYDPKTIKELAGEKRLERQRMDFLLLFSDKQRVVIEVDGKQHYSDDNDIASPKKYAEMVAGDRKLRLSGYEVYRFGGYELQGEKGKELVKDFLTQLFKKHGLTKKPL